MRIVMLVRSPCVYDTRVLREAKTLARRGHRVAVIALREEGTRPTEERDGFRILRVAAGPRAAGSAGVPFWAGKALSLAGYTWRALRAVWRAPADVYHAHDLGALPAAFLLARLRGGRLVYDSHELILEAGPWAALQGWPRRLLRFLEGALARRADAVITVSDSIADALARRYGIPRPHVVRNCPEPAALSGEPHLRRRLGLPLEVPLVLYHGGLSPHRGLHRLIESLRHLPGAVLVLMGYGPLRDALLAHARALGLGDRVAVIDAVPPGELIDVVASADVGVIPITPSLGSYRLALPNKLFECLMAGLPVAVSDLPEMAAVVRQHDVGELFDPEDPASIAAAVQRILGRPDYQEMRLRARTVARALYSWELESRALLAAYEALGRAGGGRAPGAAR